MSQLPPTRSNSCGLTLPYLIAILLTVGCAKQPADLPESETPPCAGRSCGDPCVACPGDTPGCAPAPVERQCTSEGECLPAPVECNEE